jgi:hypothetical protein
VETQAQGVLMLKLRLTKLAFVLFASASRDFPRMVLFDLISRPVTGIMISLCQVLLEVLRPGYELETV